MRNECYFRTNSSHLTINNPRRNKTLLLIVYLLLLVDLDVYHTAIVDVLTYFARTRDCQIEDEPLSDQIKRKVVKMIQSGIYKIQSGFITPMEKRAKVQENYDIGKKWAAHRSKA